MIEIIECMCAAAGYSAREEGAERRSNMMYEGGVWPGRQMGWNSSDNLRGFGQFGFGVLMATTGHESLYLISRLLTCSADVVQFCKVEGCDVTFCSMQDDAIAEAVQI